jgi:hypothetical protein
MNSFLAHVHVHVNHIFEFPSVCRSVRLFALNFLLERAINMDQNFRLFPKQIIGHLTFLLFFEFFFLDLKTKHLGDFV